MGLTLQSAGADAVTVEEFKAHSHVSLGVEDAMISGWLKAAQKIAQDITGRQITTATWVLTLDEFPCDEIKLPKGPNWSVTSITYIDTDGATQTLSTSNYELDSTTGRLRQTVAGTGWPSTDTVYNAVTITFTAGYGAAAAVPETIKAAIRLITADWYENRERPEEISAGALALLMSEWSGCYMPEQS